MFFLACFSAASAQSVTPAGTVIRNAASVEYLDGSASSTLVRTNDVTVNVAPLPSLSTINLLRSSDAATTTTSAGPTQCRNGNAFVTLAAPVLTVGTTLDVSQPVALLETSSLHGGEPLFVRLADADRNRDSAAIDTVDVQLTTAANDRETLRLAETGVATGVFVGYVQTRASAATSGNCVLEVTRNAEVSTTYIDPDNSADTSRAQVLVDPYGLVFDSSTGEPVNGARVRLINAASGAAATVFGDDGVSAYPAEMVTGTNVTDAGGTVYSLPDGVFRFPLVATGDYRIEVVPPAGHAFPSTLSASQLNQLSRGPYRLSAASFGTAFVIDAPPAVAIDLPIDQAATQLFMQKTTPTTVAAIGDFVQYSLTIQNTATNAAVPSLRTVDRLPNGMRYRAGSTRVDGDRAADPTISADGQTLTFASAALAPGRRREIRYVAEITAAASGKRLVNAAHAEGPDGIASNSAQASIELREELFRDRAFVTGRVVEGSCSVSSEKLPGVAGVRVYLEDGRYSVTDEEGKYHFDDVAPGSHVVQMDTVTLPETHQAVACADRVRNAGRAYSQFVDVRGGTLWRSDFVLEHKPLPKGIVSLALDTKATPDRSPMDRSPSAASAGARELPSAPSAGAQEGPARLSHTILLDVQQLGISNARVLVMLPEGLRYVAASARLDDATMAEPTIAETLLTFPLGQRDQAARLTFDTEATNGSSGSLVVKAVATFDSSTRKAQRTEAVENTVLRGEMLYESATYRFAPRFDVLDTRIQASDRAQLDRIVDEWRGVTNLSLSAIGHTDASLIAARSRTAFVDNDALSYARAEAVAKYLSERLAIDPARVTIEGRGADEPIATGHDPKSLALNRRVEIAIDGLRVVAAGSLTVRTASAKSPAVETLGTLALVERKPLRAAAPEPTPTPASLNVEQLQPELAWLLPAMDDVPAIPSIKVAIQHLPDQQVELRVNGSAVSPLNFDGTASNASRTASMSRWRGVLLENGENELVAVVRGEDGAEVGRLTRSVHYAGGAVRAELAREASTLVADGRTHPVIALRMVDAYGKPARPGTLGAYRVEAPYRSWWEVESLDDNKLVAIGTREPTFTVDEDGLARLELEPTAQAGTAVIRLRFNERQQQEIRVWLEPQARDWILVGIAESTAAYRTISDNMQAAEAAGIEDGYTDDGRVALFAKGAIKGEFLLTAAYDSAREHGVAKEKLLGAVEPDRFYTLYGDATEQRFEAATARKLYLKLERRQFAAMFGDFETGLTVTELSRYSRTLTGVKSDYAGEHFGYSAFAAESDQGFVKDEIQGDGTSGLYRLTRRPLIVNSDKVRIEVRDRFRSEVVIDSRPLTRFLDYSIDFLNGTVFFKQPVPSRDRNFNPVIIVAEYEVISGGEEQVTAGGRAAVKFAGDTVEIGTSFIQEGAAAGDTSVAGTDLRWNIGAATQLKAEVARTEADDPSATAAEAIAYLTELTHVTETLDARVYVREQEQGFGLGQQMNSEGGTRKAGVDGRYRFTEHMLLEAEAYRQEVLTSGAQRDHVSAEVRREADDYTLGVGARHVEDRGATVAAPNAYAGGESQQAFVNGSLDLFNDLFTLHGAQDVALGGKNSSVDFPNRSIVGIDYHFRADTTLFAEYEHADGSELDVDMTRVGVRAVPWQRAQLQSSMTQQATEFGPRVFANVGLTQGWQVTDRWALDFGVDQSKTVSGAAAAPFNPNVPLASGTLGGDFLATFVGALYRSELWTFTSRIENRTSDEEDRIVFAGGFYREPVAGHAFSLATQFFDSQFAAGTDATVGEVQLGWVYRPVTSRWIVLDRLDLKHDKTSDTSGTIESARIINNLNANWQLDMRTQMGLQLGARHVRSTFDGDRYTGTSALVGIDARRDLTQAFDVGLHGAMLNSLDANVSDVSFGVDVGLSLVKNVWISIGYNFAGFRDDDFEASRYLAQGPYLKFRMKADQDTFKDLIGGAFRTH